MATPPQETYVRDLLDYTVIHDSFYEHVWSQYHKSFYSYELQMIESITAVNPNYLQKFCETELLFYAREEARFKLLFKEALKSKNADKKFYCFLTINYDDTTSIDIKKMHKIAEQICKQKNVQHAIYVHEKHRQNESIHHHTHFLITTEKYVGAGDMIDPIFKIASVKQYVGQRNFIDCIVAHSKKNSAHAYEDYVKYISGDKKEEKMPCITKDRAWRIETGYEHQYEYKK